MIRMPHLNWPQRLAVVGGVLVFGLVGGMERADSLPLPAHHVSVGFGAAHCLPSGVWQSTLVVTADVAGGTAHLQPQGVTGFDLPMPVNNLFTIGPKVAAYTVVVTVSWPDGYVAPALTATATRPPEGCTVPTTSTTDCAHAIPIRDCTEVTTSLPTSPPSSTPTTSIPASTSSPTASTATSTSISPSPGAPLRTSLPTSTARPKNSASLPATGPPDWPAVVAAGIATAIVGAGLVLCARRRGV